MNITSNLFDWTSTELISTTTIITTTTTTTTTTAAINPFFRLLNTTKYSSHIRLTSIKNTHFIFQLPYNRYMRMVELIILSLTLPLYAIVFILFIELTVQRISSNTTISGGGTRSRSQRRRQRMRSLIWTSNYLLVDFLGLLYELLYIIIHLSGELTHNSFFGQFYCQLQIYLPLYLTVLMAYSLTAISVYRRRHFMNLNSQTNRSTGENLFLVLILWILPIITSIIPAYLLAYFNIIQIIQHETTNECQLYFSGSIRVAIYMCYRLGNIFLLPLSISFACYLTICIDLLRIQRRFNRDFTRHIHIRKNLIRQILFLFLNFAVFWIPAEIITLSTKNRLLKDTVQVTKCLNILLDPLIITGFDTRFQSALHQLLTRWHLEEFICVFNRNRQASSSSTTTTALFNRARSKTIAHSQRSKPTITWNVSENDNHISTIDEQPTRSIRKHHHSVHIPMRKFVNHQMKVNV